MIGRLALLALGAALLSGCNEKLDTASGYRAYAPVPDETLVSMTAKGTDKNAPMLIRAFKKEAELEIWKQKADGHYVYLKTFPMCRWSGQLGPKVREGDRQVPEGFYAVTPGQMNPNSAYYLSFNVGYPNAYDRAWGHTGGSIMVHGICSSAGCFSMTDKQIEEIYAIARESFAGGQRAVQMQSFPFRMTAENLAKHRLDPNIAFWRELKKGSDYFEVSKLEPPVGVCNKHYVFARPEGNARFDAEQACPTLAEDAEIVRAVADKQARDDNEVAALARKGVKPVRLVYQDGGQNPAFTGRITEESRPDALVTAPMEIALDDSPKAKPVVLQIASAKAAAARSALLAAKEPVRPGVNGSVVAASGSADRPAAFAAAPSAYATDESKSATRSFFDRVLSFGAADPAPTLPQPALAQPLPATMLPPQRQAVGNGASPQAALSKAIGGGLPSLDPGFVAYAPIRD